MITKGMGTNQRIILKGFGLTRVLRTLGRIEDIGATITSIAGILTDNDFSGEITNTEFLSLISDNAYAGTLFLDTETGELITPDQIAQITNQLNGKIAMEDYEGNIIDSNFTGTFSENEAEISENEYSGELSWIN